MKDPSGLLRTATPRAWIEQACDAIPTLLIDHANCEKKAASTALALMFAYAEDLHLTQSLSRLAREELRHYEQVIKLMRGLSIEPVRLAPGRYAQRLRALVARTEPRRELDLMVCGAFIEARSCERFETLAPCLPGPVGGMFGSLHAAELRHQGLYLELAERVARRHGLDLEDRLDCFSRAEAALIEQPDSVFRFHSGVPEAGAGSADGTRVPPSS
ncbi:MAG: tRNA-(ms[2]io[6]A)-hydroxylase [Proteobacteria bacterium]|nr:tRNA-(ms[2]io[6]A)-hydroxylase [Pseudomonadota bacterium]